jgi:dihydropteroate synthase
MQPPGAVSIAGGWTWFTHVERLERQGPPQIMAAHDMPARIRETISAPRPPICGMDMALPRIMGILNTTPDSFSDGGDHFTLAEACRAAAAMTAADIIDVGGESTRPGAQMVPVEEEIRRTVPVIEMLKGQGLASRVSIDTRKTAVAEAAHAAGADLVNDVSGFTFDPALAPFCAGLDVPVCVMHAQGDPATMQQAPHYEDVVLDVYDFLAERIEALVAAGVARTRIIADPGIGFGKTLEHNLALLERMSVFHGLGVPVLLGASRKRFIGTISGAEDPKARLPGSLAVALAALHQGVQIVRVHDVAETAQAIALWRAAVTGEAHG